MNPISIYNCYDPMHFNSDRATHSHPWLLEISILDTWNDSLFCIIHCYCGQNIKIGDILFLTKTMQRRNGLPRLVVRTFKVNKPYGFTTCHVGYLPERYFNDEDIDVFDGMYLKIVFDDRNIVTDLTSTNSNDSILTQIIPYHDLFSNASNILHK
jgi:hypothetical protein